MTLQFDCGYLLESLLVLTMMMVTYVVYLDWKDDAADDDGDDDDLYDDYDLNQIRYFPWINSIPVDDDNVINGDYDRTSLDFVFALENIDINI